MTVTDTTTPTLLSTTSPDAPAGASGEVRAKRRLFSAAEKLRILREAERCPKGELGALLRREGVYSSHLTTWRRQRERGELAALAPRKRGPQIDEQAQRLAQLEREKARLEAKLQKAELIIDAQKKLLQLLGLPEAEPLAREMSETG
jgi:transposase-like protein